MLDSYHDEVRRKRNSYAIFWGLVFLFAVLLFMFFQGYYFSVRLGFEQLLQKSPDKDNQSITQILKSFGIINLKVNPEPRTLTLNGQPYVNGDKKFVDYGNYELNVAEPDYIPLTLDIELSRNHAFYLNTIRLFKNPAEKPFERNTDRIEKLGAGFLSFGSGGSVFKHTLPNGTGAILDKVLNTSSTGAVSTGTGITATSLGEGYFSYKNRIYALNPEGLLVLDDTFKAVNLCPNARMIHAEVYCPDTRKFLTGKYKDLRDTILEVNAEFIRTESSLIRFGGTLFNSSTPLTSSVTFNGPSKLISYRGKQVILNQNKLYDIEDNFKEIKVEGFDGILRTEKFGDEIVTIGIRQSATWIRIEDGKNSMTEAKLQDFEGKDVAVSLIGGAFIISSEKEVVLYYKGARTAYQLARGYILGVMDKTIIYNRDGKTYSLTLEEGGI